MSTLFFSKVWNSNMRLCSLLSSLYMIWDVVESKIGVKNVEWDGTADNQITIFMEKLYRVFISLLSFKLLSPILLKFLSKR